MLSSTLSSNSNDSAQETTLSSPKIRVSKGCSVSKRVILEDTLMLRGLPDEFANEEILSEHSYLGQFGKISLIKVAKDEAANNNKCNKQENSSSVVFVTFETKLATAIALFALESFGFEGNKVQTFFAVGKYCTKFAEGGFCMDSDCSSLHKLLSGAKSYNKKNTKKKHLLFEQRKKEALQLVQKNKYAIIEDKNILIERNKFPGIYSALKRVEFLGEERDIFELQILEDPEEVQYLTLDELKQEEMKKKEQAENDLRTLVNNSRADLQFGTQHFSIQNNIIFKAQIQHPEGLSHFNHALHNQGYFVPYTNLVQYQAYQFAELKASCNQRMVNNKCRCSECILKRQSLRKAAN